MSTLYKSKKGEVFTKAEWLEWANRLYKGVDMGMPVECWDRLTKVLQLEKVNE